MRGSGGLIISYFDRQQQLTATLSCGYGLSLCGLLYSILSLLTGVQNRAAVLLLFSSLCGKGR